MNDLEQVILGLLLRGDEAQLVVLRSQAERATVTQRNFTGVGFFTHFGVPGDLSRTVPANFELADVSIEVKGLEFGAGVVLFISDGVLDVLECYTYGGEDWPADPQLKHITYLMAHADGLNLNQLVPSTNRDRRYIARRLAT